MSFADAYASSPVEHVSGPLAAMTVLDMGRGLAAAHAAALLGDLGATVVKFEPPAGDPSREHRPAVDGISTAFAVANRNKKSVAIDLDAPLAQDVVHRLLDGADVLIEDAPPERGTIGSQQAHEINASLVHCMITGFPQGARPGHELLVHAEAGLLSLFNTSADTTGEQEYIDLSQVTGLWASQATLAALLGTRQRASLSISMLDTALWLAGRQVSAYLASGATPAVATQSISGVYDTRTRQIAVLVESAEALARFMHALGLPEPSRAELAAAGGGGDAHERTLSGLKRMIQQALAVKPAERWISTLQAAEVPVAPVRGLPDAVQHYALASKAGLRCLQDLGPTVVAPPVVCAGRRWPLPALPADIGADTVQVLVSAGFSEGEIKALRAERIIIDGQARRSSLRGTLA